MSKVSSKARYEAFMEWHKWASAHYSPMKRTKRVNSETHGNDFKTQE